MGKNSIEINGHSYDAATGERLSSVVRKPTMSDVVRRPGSHAKRHQPATSQTLMRQAVKKPAASHRKSFKAHGQADVSAQLALRASDSSLDQRRLQHARRVAKSKQISHFGTTTSDAASPTTTMDSPQPPHKLPLPVQHVAPVRRPKTTADVLERALRAAPGHEQPVVKKPRSKHRRAVGIGAVGALTVLLIVVIGAQALPSLRLRVASARAGFSASLPGYRPAGYSLSQLHYSSGVVATAFHSNSDQRAYTITQKRTTWDSQALRTNFVVPTDSHYQTVQSNGMTIYLYGNHNATWVNNGIWYTVDSNGALGDNQLVELATSP